MDEYILNFIKQNPQMPVECPECGCKNMRPSQEFFSSDSYTTTCDKCGETTTYNVKRTREEFRQKLERLGVKILHKK